MFQDKTIAAIVLAAGSSLRYGEPDKLYETLEGRPLLCKSVETFLRHPLVDEVVLVARADRLEHCRRLLPGRVRVLAGGETRCASSLAGVSATGCHMVLLHDAARPFVTHDIIDRCIFKAAETGAAAAAIPAVDTIKLCDGDGRVEHTPRRAAVWQVQTPQAFLRDRLADAARGLDALDPAVTDDCMVMERAGHGVYLVEGHRRNFKVTTAEDYREAIRQAGEGGREEIRTAIGQDSHRFDFEDKRKRLVLGGVPIENHPALRANSDGDVLLHALCNALSGLTGVNILGERADALCRGGVADSAVYVAEALAHLKGRLCHLSFSVECSTPHLAEHIPAMRRSIAALTGLPESSVGLTATSGEGLTDFGRGLGIAVLCVATGEVGA